MPRYIVAYDDDCTVCTRFMRLVDFFDIRHNVSFVPLTVAEISGLLDAMPRSRRFTSFHLITSDGQSFSGADALPRLAGQLPFGRLFSSIMIAPGVRGVTVLVYAAFSRLHGVASCSPTTTETR